MTTKYDVGEKIKFVVEGFIKRIEVNCNVGNSYKPEITYTVLTHDGNGNDTYMYFNEDQIRTEE